MSKSEDLISVIIPVYKVEATLDRCISSIIEQTYTRLEIILIDDGSPDNCPEKCEQWANKDGRIHILHKSNGGLSSARNAGIKIAHGTWIAFVDSDDWVEKDYIEILHNTAIQNNAEISICNFYDERFPEDPIPTIKSQNISGINLFKCTQENNKWQYRVVWNKLYYSKLLNMKIFPEGKIHEDEFIYQKIIPNAKKISVIDKPLYHYTVNKNGITHSKFSIKNLDKTEAIINRLQFCINNRFTELYQPLSVVITDQLFTKSAKELKILRDKDVFKRMSIQAKEYSTMIPLIKKELTINTYIKSIILSMNPYIALFIYKMLGWRQSIQQHTVKVIK